KMKPLCLVFGLCVLIGCFLSSECQRGFRGQHDPTRPLSPSNPSSHFYPQPDPNRVQISQPDNIPIFMFEQPHSLNICVPPPPLYLGEEFEKLPPNTHIPYILIRPDIEPPSKYIQPVPRKKSNATPAANNFITTATAPNSTDSF
ncbi:mCG17774, isoform CRA_d, partial [Mus musculus]